MTLLTLAFLSNAHASDLSDAMREQAPTNKNKSVDVHLEREINASADAVWALLGAGFAEIGGWAALVDASREMTLADIPEGLVVAPQAPVLGRWTATGFGEPGEVLVMYSDVERALTFHAIDLPGFLKHSQNTQQVLETGENTCTVTFDIHAQPKFGFMAKKLESIFSEGLPGVLDDLAAYAETGEQSVAKKAAVAALD